ncbi:MAG: PEP-CTERM sorting domain-containing protein [bacterium]
MKKRCLRGLVMGIFLFGVAGLASAVNINFTGGTAYLADGSTYIPNNNGGAWNVDYYVEDGFRVDYIGNVMGGWDAFIGDYYSVQNDVAHGHWATGGFGSLTSIQVTKVGGGIFSLKDFQLTSNTQWGGMPASGNELLYINSSNGFSQLLPPEDWGLGQGIDPVIMLGSNFSNITSFSFTVANEVACFGMDNINIVPEPCTMFLLGIGLMGFAGFRRKLKKRFV